MLLVAHDECSGEAVSFTSKWNKVGYLLQVASSSHRSAHGGAATCPSVRPYGRTDAPYRLG